MLWPGATTRTKQMTAVSGLRAKTSTLVTLGTAVDFWELLTVMGSFAPTATSARFVARWTFSFRIREIIHVHPFGPLTGDDLIPVDGAHMAQIIVIDHAHIAGQDVYKVYKNINNVINQIIVWKSKHLPLSAGNSRLFIFDNMTNSENSSSLTANLNWVRPRMICSRGNTILLTSTWVIRTYPVTSRMCCKKLRSKCSSCNHVSSRFPST